MSWAEFGFQPTGESGPLSKALWHILERATGSLEQRRTMNSLLWEDLAEVG